MDELTKKCIKCGEVKGLGGYHKQSKGLNGLCSTCKVCRSAYAKVYNESYYKNNRDKIVERAIKYNKDNPDRVNERIRLWRKNNPDRAKERDRVRRENEGQKISEAINKWREKNPDKVKAYLKKSNKRYKKNNPEKVKEWKSNYLIGDNYMIDRLKKCSLPITPETIELKRNIILIKRFKKQVHEKSTSTI